VNVLILITRAFLLVYLLCPSHYQNDTCLTIIPLITRCDNILSPIIVVMKLSLSETTSFNSSTVTNNITRFQTTTVGMTLAIYAIRNTTTVYGRL